MPIETKDVVTASIAAVGAVLGIINTWNSFSKDRVRLRVVAGRADVESEPGVDMAYIEVTNLSNFPVTIREVGFTLSGDPRKQRRWAVGDPITFDAQRFPRRIESRQAVTGYLRLAKLPPDVRRPYALTDCGEVRYDHSNWEERMTYVRTRRSS